MEPDPAGQASRGVAGAPLTPGQTLERLRAELAREDIASWDSVIESVVRLTEAWGELLLAWDARAGAVVLEAAARRETLSTRVADPGVLRSLLARIATVVAARTRQPWDPYELDESSELCGVHLRIVLRNTSAAGFSLRLWTLRSVT